MEDIVRAVTDCSADLARQVAAILTAQDQLLPFSDCIHRHLADLILSLDFAGFRSEAYYIITTYIGDGLTLERIYGLGLARGTEPGELRRLFTFAWSVLAGRVSDGDLKPSSARWDLCQTLDLVPDRAEQFHLMAEILPFHEPDTFGDAMRGVYHNLREGLEFWAYRKLPPSFRSMRDFHLDYQAGEAALIQAQNGLMAGLGPNLARYVQQRV